MDIVDLRIFSRVARVQNLSAVGVELDLSPGTVSKRIQALEAELGVRLFDRSTRSIELTQEGELLLGRIEGALADIDAAVAIASAHVTQPRGRLRIAMPTSLARGALAPAICAFMASYPEIEVHVDLTERAVSFPESGYDVAIRVGELADSASIAKRLASDPHVLVAAPDYLARYGAPETPQALTAHSCLVLGENHTWTLRQGREAVDVRVSGRLRSDNGELLRHAAIEGFGILKVSRSRVAAALQAGLLVPVLAGYDAGADVSISAVYPSNRHVLPKLKAFLDFMVAWYRDEPRTKRGMLAQTPDGGQPAEA